MDLSIAIVGIVVTALAVVAYQVKELRYAKGPRLAPKPIIESEG